ncbi:sigma-54-dependent transcriptional regulator [Alteribacillus sp. JSM 102045]|uniref:sigma-54-dependent transcriptional regulator n=1 Tax=Alteribacillus sp. JSM 102045 TaxID=1562101 RepID=UPI0035BF984D
MNILTVDDDREILDFFNHLLDSKGYKLYFAHDKKSAEDIIKKRTLDIAFIDLKLPDVSGLDLLKKLKQTYPSCKVVMMTGYSTVQTAVEAIKLGAEDYIEKPFEDITHIEKVILPEKNKQDVAFFVQLAEQNGLLVGKSERMKEVVRIASKFAAKNLNILINGETGTGKEVMAKYIHEAANKHKDEAPFFALNCGALAEQVLESELFGHETGAFTGATKRRKGYFELASNGTLLLDEIGEAGMAIQVKLLRILESKEFMRVGGERILRTGARILSATNRDLRKEVEKDRFREDLLFRLEAVTITLPPLRERKEDLLELSYYILKKEGLSHLSISEEALTLLQEHDWPGNIRELTNVLLRASTEVEGNGNVLFPNHLHISLNYQSGESTFPNIKDNDINPISQEWKSSVLKRIDSGETLNLSHVIEDMKKAERQVSREIAKKALQTANGSQKEAAEQLCVNPRKLRYILNEKI